MSNPAVIDNLHIFAFTERGQLLADNIATAVRHQNPAAKISVSRVVDLQASLATAFVTGNTLLFVGAAGIAVRGIAPYLKAKTSDPAVLVVDEKAAFIIPLLSGHIGGANRSARRLAELIGATAVLTTATDVNQVFAIDTYAVEHGYAILNPEVIKLISAALLAGREVGLDSDFPITGPLPPQVSASDSGPLGISISLDSQKQPFLETLRLVPKCIHVGIGTRKGIDPNRLLSFFLETLDSLAIPPAAVAALASIDLKKAEAAILNIARLYGINFVTYSAAELASVAAQFKQSSFVQETTGVGNVSEAAAYLSSGQGAVVLPKIAKNGMTLAITREDWRVSFEVAHDRT